VPRITISQVKDALPRIETGLKKYRCLRCRFLEVNVSKDLQFQKECNGFFRIRQKPEKFYNEYYKFLEKHKNDTALTFEKVLEHLYAKTGYVVPSFASKLLSMVNPDKSVLDSRVLTILDIKPVRHHPDPRKRIERGIAVYKAICEWYEHHFKSGEAAKWIKLFDEHYPDAKGKITDVKKIDLILWQIRD